MLRFESERSGASFRPRASTCADRGVLGRVAVGLEQQRQQVAAHLHAAGAVEIAEVQIGIDESCHSALRSRIRMRTVPSRGAHLGLVPQLDAHGRRPELARDLLHEPTVEPARLLARCRRVVKSVARIPERPMAPNDFGSSSILRLQLQPCGPSKPLPLGLTPSSAPAGRGAGSVCQMPSPRLKAAVRSVFRRVGYYSGTKFGSRV